jgi:hypothetical protein
MQIRMIAAQDRTDIMCIACGASSRKMEFEIAHWRRDENIF